MRFALIHRFGGNPGTGEPPLQIVHKADAVADLMAHARYILTHVPVGPSELLVRCFSGAEAETERDAVVASSEAEIDFDARTHGMPVRYPAIEALARTISAAGELAAVIASSQMPGPDFDDLARKGAAAARAMIAAAREAGLTTSEMFEASVFDQTLMERIRVWSSLDARYGDAVAEVLGRDISGYYMRSIFGAVEPQPAPPSMAPS